MKLKIDEGDSHFYVVQKDCKVLANADAKPPTVKSPCPSKRMYNPKSSNPKIVDSIKKEISYREYEFLGY